MTDIRPEDEVVRICQELIRIDTSNYGDGSGPGERAAAEYTAGLMTEVGLDAEIFESAPGPRQRGDPDGRRGPLRQRPGGPRAPGRRPGPPRPVVGGSLRRRTQGRHDLGPRRRGHEGHGRHDPRRAAELCPHRPQAQAGPDLRLLRRRGSRRHLRRPLRRREPPRTLRRRHRGHLRGRRLLRHHRRPAHLPAADRREGPLLAPARRPRPRRPRLPDQHRQRRDPARQRGLPHRRIPAGRWS